MNERNFNQDRSQPELTSIELNALVNKAELYGLVTDVPNPHDQPRDKPLPHAYVLALDHQYVALLDRYNDALPRNYLEQINAVHIEYAEARLDNVDAHTLLDPYVAIRIYKNMMSDDTPLDGIDMVTKCYFSLQEGGERFVIDTYDDIGEKKRTLSREDVQLLRRIVKGD